MAFHALCGFPCIEEVIYGLLYEMREVKIEKLRVHDPLFMPPTYINTWEWEKQKIYWVDEKSF